MYYEFVLYEIKDAKNIFGHHLLVKWEDAESIPSMIRLMRAFTPNKSDRKLCAVNASVHASYCYVAKYHTRQNVALLYNIAFFITSHAKCVR